MAKFCSECGANTTDLMRQCPRCGAPLMNSSQRGTALVRGAIIAIGTLIIFSTFLGWYNIKICIDSGILDAIAAPVTRTLFSYSGISTTYGITIFSIALAMIVLCVCRSRYLTALAAAGCVVVGIMAIVTPPEVAELMGQEGVQGRNLMENFTGPLQGMSPLSSPKMASWSIIFEVISDYMSVELLHGIKIMLILSCAAFALSIYDIVRARMK